MSSDIIRSFMEGYSFRTKNFFLPNLKLKSGIITNDWKLFPNNNKSALKIYNCINKKTSVDRISKTNNYAKSYKKRLISPIYKKEARVLNKIKFHNEFIKNSFHNSNEQSPNERSKIINTSIINITDGNLYPKPIIKKSSNKMDCAEMPKNITSLPEKNKRTNLRKEKIPQGLNSLANKKNDLNCNLDITIPKICHKKLLLKDCPIDNRIDPVSYIKYNLLTNPSKSSLQKSIISLNKIEMTDKINEYSKIIFSKGCEISNNQFSTKHMKVPSFDENNIYKKKYLNAIEDVKRQPSFHFNLDKKRRTYDKYIVNCDGFYRNSILNRKKGGNYNNKNYLSFEDQLGNVIESSKDTMKNFEKRNKEYEVLIKKIQNAYEKNFFL